MVSIFVAHHKKILSIILKMEDGLTSFLEEVKDQYEVNYDLLKRHAEELLRIHEAEMELHLKSEEALFPHIDDKEKIAELLNDHRWIREKIRYMRGLDVKKKPREIVENLTQLIKKIKEHSEKENKLYSEWENKLTEEQIEEISRKVEEIYCMKE